MSAAAYDPMPLALAILEEYDPAPLALLAAWKCVYRDDCDDLVDLAYRAAVLSPPTPDKGTP